MSDETELAVVIMAGGAGTRFWPMSTEARPKQFLNLFGERTLLQMSYDRVAGMVPPERVLVMTNRRFVPMAREQLPEVPVHNVIGEPMRRDTAAAVALAALLCQRRFGDPVMAVLTADHLIRPRQSFQATLRSAVRAVRGGGGERALYTFGVRPTRPATEYGYLQRGEPVPAEEGFEHYRLERFREKPDQATAERYVESRGYYWNSGMFVWGTEAILAQLEAHLPAHLRHLRPALALDGSAELDAALEQAFEPLRPISIDYGVMEKAEDVRCVVASFQWSDVGGWLALDRFLERDRWQNAVRGQLQAYRSRDNLVFCEDPEEVVALVGVEDLVVVRTGKRTLVVPRGRAEEIKKLVKGLDPELR